MNQGTKLTTMTVNALINACLENGITLQVSKNGIGYEPPTREMIASIPYDELKSTYSLGKYGLRDVELWLSDGGFQILDKPNKGRFSQSRINEATNILTKSGYTVIGPKE